MFETNNFNLKALYQVYKTPEILKVPSQKWKDYDLGKETSLTTYEKWMHHKYLHTFQVLKEGAIIINKEPLLKNTPDIIKKEWMDALLMHDYGRAFEVSPNKENYNFSFCHGITGAQKALELGETSLNILIPVLVHDQMDNAFIDLSDTELEKIEKFAKQPQSKKDAVYKIRELYQKTTSQEKEWIKLGIGLVRDADTLSNLREYKRMLKFLEKSPKATISPTVYKEILAGDYVKVEYVKTWPDKCCMYLSWAYHFNYPSTFKEVFHAHILENFCEDIFNKIKPYNTEEDLLKLRQEINFILKHIENFDAQKNFIVPVMSEISVKREEITNFIQSYLFQNKV